MEYSWYMDRHILCRSLERKGKSPLLAMFNDRRAGMTFPTTNNDGYWCIFGQQETATVRDKLPLELLAEGTHGTNKALFLSLIKHMRMLGCKYVYADCSKANERAEIEFDRVVASLNAQGVGLWDASEFDGFESSYSNFDAARGPAQEYGSKGLLKIPGAYRYWGKPDKGRWPKQSILTQDLTKVGAETARSTRPWEMFPAANAFNHVIMSYVISPYTKPTKEYNQNDSEGYCG
jgi:hypothetical protein